MQTGDNFFLEAISTGSGPVLKYSGSPVSATAFGTWAPIAAEQTGGGYDVAWKDAATGLYTVWSTDSNGNYTANIVPQVTGTNASLRSIETTFQQDLNGDGTIGVPPAAAGADASSATELLQRHNEGFVFQPGIELTGKTDTSSIHSGLPDLSSRLLDIGLLLETQASSFDHGSWEGQRSDQAFSSTDHSSPSHITELLMRTFLFH
nr:hypothetical protein [Bradyrhizobium guangxiense]